MTRAEEQAGTQHRSGQGSPLLGDLGGSVAVSWRKMDRFRNVRVMLSIPGHCYQETRGHSPWEFLF